MVYCYDMSAKLVIHKFDTVTNYYKVLQIDLKNDDLSDTKFGDWIEGVAQQGQKEVLSRLLVKIVSGNDINTLIDIDSCAKKVDTQHEIISSDINKYWSSFNPNNTKCSTHIEFDDDFLPLYYKKYDTKQKGSKLQDPKDDLNIYFNDVNNTENLNRNDCHVNPLEYSLERVKENNARIMENIHILNRTISYTKKKENLDNIVFPKSMRTFPCNSCGKCFVYETGLRRHYSIRHAITGVPPRWQVVWTCVECFQVWPQHDLAVKHSVQCCKTENTEFVREIKISSLLQCEFCEKVYTNIPRLLHHSKMHGSTNNYECNACDMAFTSYKSAEQHWLTCPWLKLYYSFSLPKLFLCNGCDRKFRNYDQLYTHRHKVGHFITKVHYDDNSQDVSVYQCELCGQWFLKSALLLTHRIQYHPVHDTEMQDIHNSIDDNLNLSM